MAEFMATAQGGRGEASRLGHKSTGARTTCNGWSAGVAVSACDTDQGNQFDVLMNEGNGYNAGRCMHLGTVEPGGNGPTFYPSPELVAQILAAHGVGALPGVERIAVITPSALRSFAEVRQAAI